MRAAVIFIVFNVLILARVTGQTSDSIVRLSLFEAQQYAVENSVQTKNAALDVEKADKVVWQTTSEGLPQIGLNANYTHVPGDIATFSISDGFGGIFALLDSIARNDGIDPQPFFGEPAEPAPVIPKNTIQYTVNFSQLLFSGRYIVALQATKTFLKLSNQAQQQAVLDVKESVANAYIGVLILESNLEILDSTLINVEDVLRGARVSFEQGVIESNELLQLELTAQSLQNTRRSAQRQRDAALMMLKIQLGLESASNLQLTQNLDEAMVHVNNFTYDPDQFQIDENVQYQMLLNDVDAKRLQWKSQKASWLPELSAFYQYQDETNIGFADFSPPHSLGLNLKFQIFSSGMRLSQISQAKIDLAKSQNNQFMQTEMIKAEAMNLKNAYETALDNYKYEQKNVELAQKILDQTQTKFELGMAQSLDVKIVNNQYLESYGNLMMAMQQLIDAKLKLDKIHNKL